MPQTPDGAPDPKAPAAETQGAAQPAAAPAPAAKPAAKGLGHFSRCDFAAGQTIFSQGDRGDHLYFVTHGRVRIWRTGADGKPVELAEITDGGVFGEMALIDQKPRSAHATAITATTLQLIPGQLVHAKLAQADPFLRKLIQILSRNLRQSSEALPPLPRDIENT